MLSDSAMLAAYPFLFLAGLCIGSFLNVLIYRLPRDESIVSPRSRCPSCSAMITWYRNIPVVSFLLLKGKCGSCGVSISKRYPLVELLTAVLFLLAVWKNPFWPSWFFVAYFIGALVASTFIDLEHWIIPDKITLPGIVVGFAGSFLSIGWLPSLVGILLGGGILYAVAWAYKLYAGKDGIGGGDIKFLAMIGAFIGAKGAVLTLVLSSLVGSVVGLTMILAQGKKSNTAIPFGPFLSVGALAAFLFGDFLWAWYFNIR